MMQETIHIHRQYLIEGMGNETIGNYTTIDKLPKGLFGKTRLTESPDHIQLAVKIYEATDPALLPALLVQTKATLSFKSKRIINIRDILQLDERRFAVGMDYYPTGSLAVHLELKAMKAMLLEMRELALAVKLLHEERRIPHGNIKPNNIFPTQNSVVLADIHCPHFHSLRQRPKEGGFDYWSKQHFEGKGTFESDVFSVGLVFIEMVTGRRIRDLMGLGAIEKPSLVLEQYPSQALLDSLPDFDLQSTIRKMVTASPPQRLSISKVIEHLTQLITGKPQQKLIEPLVKDELEPYRALESIRQFTFSFDQSHPCWSNFQFVQNKLTRISSALSRYQAVARECIPTGKWQITVRVQDYGSGNEEIAIGLLSEERRKEKMSGDIDQDHSVAFWSNCKTGKGSLCENGVWNSEGLPGLKVGGVLNMVVDTVERGIEWWVDRQLVGVSSLALGFWSQEYYMFFGLMGQGCSVRIGKNKFSNS